MGPPTTARHRFAPTATMTITRTPARRTAIMDLSGSRVACLSAQARGSTGFTAAAFTALADSRAGSTAISTATAFAAEVSLTRALSAEGLPAAKCMAVEGSTDSMAEGSTAAVTAGAADMINEPGGQNKKR